MDLKKKLFLCLLFLSFFIEARNNKGEIDYGYPQKLYHIAQKSEVSTAIMIVAYKRPNLLKRLLDSLEKNPESQTLPFYFFLEGGSGAKQEENINVIKAAHIKNKHIIKRDRNYGCPKNFIDGRRLIFDWCNYDRLIVLEEDIVVSPYYIKFLLNLHAWAKSKFSNVGIVQAWSYCFLDLNKKKKSLNRVRQGVPWWSFVTYCLDKAAWNSMKNILYEYELFINEIPHDSIFDQARSKPKSWIGYPKMKQWALDKISMRVDVFSGPEAFPNMYPKIPFNEIFTGDSFAMNQDNMNAFALWMAGLVKIQTVVNRAIHTGIEGGLSNDRFQKKDSAMVLDLFPSDAMTYEFIPIGSKEIHL